MKGERATRRNKKKAKWAKLDEDSDETVDMELKAGELKPQLNRHERYSCVSINLLFYLFGLFQDFVKRSTAAMFIVIRSLSCCLLPKSSEFTVQLKTPSLCLIERHMFQTMSTQWNVLLLRSPE
jgi:hypothetical protein